MEIEYKVVEETPTFYIAVGTMPRAKLEEYLVINKQYGVIEYNNPILYFVKEWSRQMEEHLEEFQRGNSNGFPPPSNREVN